MQTGLIKLDNLFAEHGASGYLGYTQNFIVLIDSSGNLVEWNPAFDKFKKSNPNSGVFQDYLENSSKSLFAEAITTAQPRQTQLQMRAEYGGGDFNCLLNPLPDDHYLVHAEPLRAPRDEELRQLSDELSKTRRMLRIKQVELESVMTQADEISHTDALTFLPNRRRIVADLQREVISSDRHHRSLTVFMADIDHFKLINDTYGHGAGDQVLRIVSAEMLSTIRQIDKLGRYGGEEFMLILPTTTQKAATKIADRLLEVVRERDIELDDGTIIHLTISIGIAQYRIGKESWEDLVNRADQAMYASKTAGRNCWSLSGPAKKTTGSE